MRLIHNQIETQISFDCETSYTLVVESPIVMNRLVSDLKAQIRGEEGGFVFSENDLKEIDISYTCELIIDPFVSADDNKKFATKLLQYLKMVANQEDFFERTAQIKSALLQYALIVMQDTDESLIYKDEIDTGTLLKVFSFMFDFSDPSPIENLVTYVKVANKYLAKSLFVFVNMRSFFTNEELSYLIDTVHGMKCNILFLENVCPKLFEDKEKYSIIDIDQCEIF
nr:type II-A CRISPR-associated protein Csn2 [uncultured Sphaerochaeta sp.]